MQSILSRDLIHEDFFHGPSSTNYWEFMRLINKAKHQLLEWGFDKGNYSVIHLMSNTTDALAFQFAMWELGIGIAIPPEDMFDTPEQNKSEHWKTIDSYFREFVRCNNSFPIHYSIDDRSDTMMGGAITKSQIYGKIYMDTTEEFGIRHGHYMGKMYDQSDADIDAPWEVTSDVVATGGFKTGSGWGYGDWEKGIKCESFADKDICWRKSHEEVFDAVMSSCLDMKGKTVGLSKTLLHHNALERHVLPAIIQSGRIIDMPIPEYNLGNTFIEGIFIGDVEITKEMMYEFVCKNATNLMIKYEIDCFASPSDEALFSWLDIYNNTKGDFIKPIECLIHTEPTQDHEYWENKMNIKFVFDGDEFQYGA